MHDPMIANSPARNSTIVVCPLRIEASRIRRGLRSAGVRDIEVACCGPGQAGIERWASHVIAQAGATIILAGLAGSIGEQLRVRQACMIDLVRSESGEQWLPPLRSAAAQVVITSSTTIVGSVDDRRALAQRTGAQLVDLESVAFAAIAVRRGWRWGIVRGVSDDLRTRAPEQMGRWIDDQGRTRVFTVLAALARNPRLIAPVRCLHHNSTRALDAVVEQLREIVPGDKKNA